MGHAIFDYGINNRVGFLAILKAARIPLTHSQIAEIVEATLTFRDIKVYIHYSPVIPLVSAAFIKIGTWAWFYSFYKVGKWSALKLRASESVSHKVGNMMGVIGGCIYFIPTAMLYNFLNKYCVRY